MNPNAKNVRDSDEIKYQGDSASEELTCTNELVTGGRMKPVQPACETKNARIRSKLLIHINFGYESITINTPICGYYIIKYKN